MTPAPSTTTAAADPTTATWLRAALRRAALIAVAAVATGAASSVVASTEVSVALRAAAALLACWSVMSVRTWAKRRAVLRSAPWRPATLVDSATATLFGTARTTLAVTYPTGTTIPYRLDDFAGVRAASALASSATVWVASCPTGTVIATPTLEHAAGARPQQVRSVV